MKPVGVLLRLDPTVLAQIDAARGRQERTTWIRRAIDASLGNGAVQVAPTLLDPPPVDPTASDAATYGSPDPMVAEIVGEAPAHRHRREKIEQHYERGVLLTTYRCSVCGVALG